jgi:carbonic anhydrase
LIEKDTADTDKPQHTEFPHWGYTSECGPSSWGGLCPEFSLCDTGKNQSPINLTGYITVDLSPLYFDYQCCGYEIVNKGHSVQVNALPGSTLTTDGHTFELKQYHFHVPSENLIDEQSYPMESHFVHADEAGNIAVVAVMYVVGAENENLAQAWAQIPEHEGEETSCPDMIPVEGLLRENKAYYRFNGSLTTPPCTEGVCWFDMKEPVNVSQAQIDCFAKVMGCPNNRPVRPVNARIVLG